MQRYRYSPSHSSRERRRPFWRSRACEEARAEPRAMPPSRGASQEPGMGVGRPSQGARKEGWLAVCPRSGEWVGPRRQGRETLQREAAGRGQSSTGPTGLRNEMQTQAF